jgi:hypothetical protein
MLKYNNIRELFENNLEIRIPAYQRAYTWERKQWKQFFDDLVEQKGKTYYLGQILFEEDGNTLYVIDGQQRLTTIVIFMSVISAIKKSRNIDSNKQALYLNDSFQTIDDDQIIFRKVTQKYFHTVLEGPETSSQERITNASVFFYNELEELPDDDLNKIQITLENAIINTFCIKNKIEAAQVFEYQNNRGKELTHFEIIKAYLMCQVYINSSNHDDANNFISEIQKIVSNLYRNLESVEGFFTEAELLNNFCDLYFNTDSSIDSIKKEFAEQDNKLNWIKDFFENFAEISLSAKNIIKNIKPETANLFFAGNEVNWKIVLLALFSKGDNKGDFYNNILKLLEILCIKMKLTNFRSDYLPTYTKSYYFDNNYGIGKLYEDIHNSTEAGFKRYWNNDDYFKNIIEDYFDNNTFHYQPHIIKYVLWQYENKLRKEAGSGFLMDYDLFRDYTIEHIKPQNPVIKEYTEDFEKKYLHLAGNLALLTRTQNIRFGNKSFEKKSELFQLTTLISYTEIREKSVWTEIEIKERHNNISLFVKEYFNIGKL